MRTIDLRRGLMAVAIVSLALTASTLSAQHHHGGGYHGNRGHHDHGHGHPSHGFSGHRHPGYGYPGGLHYRGSYPGYGFSRGGLNIAIGAGYPYGGFGGFGFSAYDDPYSSYGSLYGSYPYYDYGRSGLGIGYYTDPVQRYVPADPYNPDYHYHGVPANDYGVPGYSSPFAHQPTYDSTHSMARPVSPTSDLRPGMILPGGARVISVGPLGATVPPQPDQLDQPEEIAVPEPAEQADQPE